MSLVKRKYLNTNVMYDYDGYGSEVILRSWYRRSTQYDACSVCRIQKNINIKCTCWSSSLKSKFRYVPT